MSADHSSVILADVSPTRQHKTIATASNVHEACIIQRKLFTEQIDRFLHALHKRLNSLCLRVAARQFYYFPDIEIVLVLFNDYGIIPEIISHLLARFIPFFTYLGFIFLFAE